MGRFLSDEAANIFDNRRISRNNANQGEVGYADDEDALSYFLIMAIIILVESVKLFLRGHIINFFDEFCFKVIFLFRRMIKAVAGFFHPVSNNVDADFGEIGRGLVFNRIDVCHELIPPFFVG